MHRYGKKGSQEYIVESDDTPRPPRGASLQEMFAWIEKHRVPVFSLGEIAARAADDIAIDIGSVREIARLRVGEDWSSGSGASPWYRFTRIS